MKLVSITCKSCGAPSQIVPGKNVITCAYCGSQMVLDTGSPLAQENQTIQGLPFKTDQKSFQLALINWLCEGDLTPDDILESATTIDFNGTLIPFWFITAEYSAEANCKVGREVVEKTFEVVKNEQGQIVDHKEKRNVSIDWVNTDRTNHGHYEILLLASTKIHSSFHTFLHQQTNHLTKFTTLNESNLEGHSLGVHDITAEKAFDTSGKKQIEELIEGRITQRNSEKHFKVQYVSFRSVNQKHEKVFLPFWIATFDYEGTKYPVIFDGKDLSRSFGTRPVDKKREQRFKDIDAPFVKACWITGILGVLGLIFIVPGIIIFIVGGIYCYNLKKKANRQKKIILDRSYRIRNDAKSRMLSK